MIEESYVTFEQAKALKELGFPQELHPFPCQYHEVTGQVVYCQDCIMNEYIVMPTLSLVQKWLREEKNIHLVINEDRFDLWSIWGHEINPLEFSVFERIGGFSSYEQALSAGIDKCIEILQQN